MLKLLSLFQTVKKKYDDNSLGSIIITLHFNMWMKETYKLKKKSTQVLTILQKRC